MHDFTRKWGWNPQADLDQVRDALLTKSHPGHAIETEGHYRRQEKMRYLRASRDAREAEPAAHRSSQNDTGSRPWT